MLNLREHRLENWIVPTIVGAFLFLFFPTIFLGINSFFYRDFGSLAYPIIHYQKESFLSGEIPLWNPLSHCGIPFLAQWGTMTLYPPSLFYIFLPLPWSLNFFCLLHLIFGAVGMYLFARRWINDDLPALFSTVAFVFNGIILSCLMWPNYTAALAWAPWIFYVFEKAVCTGGKYILFAIIFSVFQFMSGVPEILIITHIITFSIVIYNVIDNKARIITTVSRYLLVIISVLFICAMQLLPFLELLQQSHRTADIDFTKWSMPGWGLANFFVPLFHYFKTYQNTFVQSEQAFITSYYFPLGTLVLALLGIIRANSKTRIMFLLLIFFSISMALGSNSFIYNFASSFLPFFNKIRYPIKFIIILSFIIPVLAGLGVGQLIKSDKKAISSILLISLTFLIIAAMIVFFNIRYPFPLDQLKETVINTILRYLFLILFIAALLISLNYKNYFHILFPISLLIIAIDGKYHLHNFHPVIPSEHLESKLWSYSVEDKKPRFGEGRVFISPYAEERLLRSVVSDWTANFIGKHLALWSNLNLLEEIPKVNGAFTLQLIHQKQLEKMLYQTNNIDLDSILRFLNVTYITKPGTVVEWIKYTNSMPLIYAGQNIKLMDYSNSLNYILSPSFNPPDEVIISKEEKNKYSDISLIKKQKTTINNVTYSNHRIIFDYESEAPAIITVSQTYYKNWRAFIDGKEYPILRANYAFQAIPVPAGKHKAVIEYYDKSFIYGLLCSYIGFIVVLAAVVRRK
jgi:hypothetical protein